jgi:hypothetical protein
MNKPGIGPDNNPWELTDNDLRPDRLSAHPALRRLYPVEIVQLQAG